MHWVFLFRSSIRSVRSPITKPGKYPQRHLVEKGNLVLKGLNMNVVVSNQAVLEKNSPLVVTSFFFLTFFLVICLFLSSGNAPPASLQWVGGRHNQEGRVGPGETPHLNISTSRSVAQDSGWVWSENCCLFKVRSLGKVGQSGGFGDHIRGTCWGDTDVLDKPECFDLVQGNGYILDFVYSLDKCMQTCGTRRLVLMSAVAPSP